MMIDFTIVWGSKLSVFQRWKPKQSGLSCQEQVSRHRCPYGDPAIYGGFSVCSPLLILLGACAVCTRMGADLMPFCGLVVAEPPDPEWPRRLGGSHERWIRLHSIGVKQVRFRMYLGSPPRGRRNYFVAPRGENKPK